MANMTTLQILQGIHDWTSGKIVYDISAAHPDGQGNPTPYADLTAALGAGGANIPEGLRKGGMSVKFIQGTVQSSDHKYVQYRLTAQTFSTTVSDWQSMNADDELIEDSENLVKTKVIEKPISQLQYNCQRIYDGDLPSNTDKFAITDGNSNIALSIDEEGNISHSNLECPGKDFYIIDKNDNIAFSIGNDGKTHLVLAADSLQQIINSVTEALAPKIEIETTMPDVLYTVINDCYNLAGQNIKRQYAITCYIDRFLKTRQNVLFGNGSNRLRISCDTSLDKLSQNGEQKSMSITLNGRGYIDKNISIPIRVTRSTKLLNKHYRILCIGDSLTDADVYPSYLHKLLDMDAIDYRLRTGSDSGIVVNMIGTLTNNLYTDYTYRGQHVQTANYNEGRSSWAGYSYLYHADFYTWRTYTYNNVSKSVKHVAWRILGLYEKYNAEYSGTESQNNEIARTCNGQYSITQDCLDGWVWEMYKDDAGVGSVDYTSATSSQKETFMTFLQTTLLENPYNPFFDKATVDATKNTDFCHAFNWDKYYERYKTHDINGQPLDTIGTKADPSTMYVTVPNYIVINLGTNDNALVNNTDAEDSTYKIAQILHQQTNATCIVFTTSNPSSKFPELAAEQNASQTTSASDTNFNGRNEALKTFCGDFSNQESTKIFFCPAYWTQGFGSRRSPQLVEIGTEIPYGYATDVDDVHPNELSYCDAAYEIYAQLAYLVQENY